MAVADFAANAEFIGGLAAVLTTASFLPQVWQTVRTRQTRDLSWVWLVAFGAGVALWAAYGLVLGAPSIIVNNLLVFACVAVLALVKFRARGPGEDGDGI